MFFGFFNICLLGEDLGMRKERVGITYYQLKFESNG